MEIIFIRHAEPDTTVHNDQLRPLTAKGLSDSQKLIGYFQEIDIDKIFSSPYKRAVDTVANIAKSFDLTVEKIDNLRERTVSTGWIDNFAEFSKNQWNDFNFKLDNGESLSEVQNRNIPVILDLIAKYPTDTIVIGTHGTALSTIINYFDNTYSLADFDKIKGVMPWIAHFTFLGTKLISITSHDTFGSRKDLYNKYF